MMCRCSRCKTSKPIICFYGSTARASGVDGSCRQCTKAHLKQWRFDNPDRLRAQHSAWKDKNPDAWQRLTKRWRQENRARTAYLQAKYVRAMVTPAWADLSAIADLYELAARLTRETGVAHHVDHYYPVQGKKVCGLHVETNLQVLTGAANVKKGNKMPEEATA